MTCPLLHQVNAFYCARVDESLFSLLTTEATREEREAFIQAKYSTKAFLPSSASDVDPADGGRCKEKGAR
jgi:hypothetical protein